jgi:hypothetical protein
MEMYVWRSGKMDSESTNSVNKGKMPMSDEERKNLAEKLDEELDVFIGGLEKRSYTEGWPEDRWQEVRFHTTIRIPLPKLLQ